jgi:hypothetical protein
MADAIGSLFIDLSMHTAAFDAAARRVEAQVKALAGNIRSGFGALKSALASTGLLVAVQQAAQWTQAMAAAGEEAENLATTLGLTLEKVVQLQGVFKLTTGSLAEAQAAMLKMNGAVADARAGSETAIANFKQIGVSLQDIARVGDDPMEMLKLLADRFTEFEDGSAKSAAFFDIFGKGWAKLAPTLRGGSEEVEKLKKRFEELDPAAREAAEAGAALDVKLDELNVSVKGLSNEGFLILAPAITAAASSMTELISSIRQAISWANAALEPIGGLARVMNAVANSGFLGVVGNLAKGNFRGALDAATGKALIDAVGLGANPPMVLPPVNVQADFAGGGGRKIVPAAKGGGKGGGGGKDDALEEWKEAVATMKELADEAAEAATKLAEHTKDVGDELFNRRVQQIRHELDIEKITGQQAIDAERRVADEKWLAHQEFYRKKREAAEGDKKKIDEINQQEKVAYEQHLTEMEKFAQDKVKLRFDEFKDAARDLGNVLESSFSNAFDGITEGTFKLRTAIGGLLKDLGRMIANKAFQMLLNGGSSSSSGGGLLGSLFGMFTGGSSDINGGQVDFGGGGDLPALASGGSFRVGGSGGIDSQLIAARMTPGELVEVTPPGGGGSGEVINLRLADDMGLLAGMMDQRIQTASGTIIKVSVAQSTKAVQRNWSGMSSEASQRQL